SDYDGCPVDSWVPDTEPCGDGHDDRDSGWVGVMCDARGGRVVYVTLNNTGVGGELLPFFGRLGALLVLGLSYNPALRGDVADLAGATELRFLRLAGSGVHGPVAALRALPGLGADWGPESGEPSYGPGASDFSPCSAFGGQQASAANDYTWGTGSPGCGAAGLAPVAVSRNPRWFAR
ncbi:MAG: hypothetical protein QF548_12135, partial [Acidimicrobiales bacterium]|nr:hypothetical protein [Acidimicrobiales bacterium]